MQQEGAWKNLTWWRENHSQGGSVASWWWKLGLPCNVLAKKKSICQALPMQIAWDHRFSSSHVGKNGSEGVLHLHSQCCAVVWSTKHAGKEKGFQRTVVLAGLQRCTATTSLGFASWWLHLHVLHYQIKTCASKASCTARKLISLYDLPSVNHHKRWVTLRHFSCTFLMWHRWRISLCM